MSDLSAFQLRSLSHCFALSDAIAPIVSKHELKPKNLKSGKSSTPRNNANAEK